VSTKPGRNDPCHCGSGKKYKRCHLPLDEKARLGNAVRKPEHLEEPAHDDFSDIEPAPFPSLKTGFKNYKDVFKMVTNSSLVKSDPKLRRIVEGNETLFTYLANEDEITAALAKVEPYKDEFRRLVEDQTAFLEQCERVFSEETFASLRFTVAQVESAFCQAGVSAIHGSDEEMQRVCLQAIAILATKDLRDRLSMELLVRLPKFVDEGRYLDANLLAFASHLTCEKQDEPNPFLLRMFLYGVDAWEDKRDTQKKALLKELGLDLGDEISPEELDAWAAKQSADPAKTARLEQLIAANPELLSNSAPTLETMARQAVNLLDRDDAECLWLSEEEVATWAPFLSEKIQIVHDKYGPEEPESKIPEAQKEEVFSKIYLPAMQEVTKSVFTPARIGKLVDDLKAYRNKLFAAGEKTASYWASNAIMYVKGEDEPSLNMFLVNLCAKSICSDLLTP
jgi:hypothetical protein